MGKILRCSLLTCIITYCYFLLSCHACINILPTETTVYNATDPIIQWNPPLNDSSTWSPIGEAGFSGVQTSSSTATAKFTLQGAALVILTLDQPNFNSVLVTVNTKQFRVNLSEEYPGHEVKMTTIPIDQDGPAERSIVIQEDTGPGMNNTGWNLLGINVAPTFVVSSTSTQPLVTLSTIPQAQESANAPAREQSNGLSAGGKAGVVIGTLSGVSLAGLLFVCLRRRRRESSDPLPDPLVVSPAASPSRRPHLRRMDRGLIPHLTAPSTAMACTPSTCSTNIPFAPPLPATRQIAREKLFPPASSRSTDWRASSTLVS